MSMVRLLSTSAALLVLAAPSLSVALTGPSSRFDWSLSRPAIAADNTSTCNDTATARFDWSLGQPTVVHDATATCTAVTPAATGAPQDVFWFD